MGLRHVGAAVLALAAAPPAWAAPRTYVVDPAKSQVRVHVGRSGLFSFAGHEHEVAAPSLEGRIAADPADLAASSLGLTFAAAALTVLPAGEPAGDPPKVEEAMRGPRALDVARFPTIAFRSRAVTGREASPGVYDLQVAGDMTIRGITRAMTLPVRVELRGDALTASGRAVLRHDQFGMEPISVAGVVKVKNEIVVTYKIVARADAAK